MGFGLWCAGSSAGLMAVLAAVGMMSLPRAHPADVRGHWQPRPMLS
jgi:hypothetical protein